MKRNMIKLFCFGFFMLTISGALAQLTTPDSWTDGNTVFTKTRPADPFVSFTDDSKTALGLTPVMATLVDDTLNLSLDGVDWEWPNSIILGSAQDIDYRKIGDQELYMVVDASARRVLEYNISTKTLSWEYGSTEPSNSQYLDRPVDARIFQDDDGLFKVLITDKTNHRVVKINQTTKTEEWSFGTAGLEGSGDNFLSNPEDAIEVPGKDQYLIADAGNDRILLVDEATKNVIWKAEGVFNNPADLEYSEKDSAILVTDKGNDRIVLMTVDSSKIIWQFPEATISDLDTTRHLNAPSDADILENGNILIADEGKQRLIEVDRDHNIVWEFNGKISGLKDADRLPDNKHIAVHFDENFSSNRPVRLGYTSESYISEIYDLDKQVLFETIFWETEKENEDTSVRFQLRSANSLSALEVASWNGPDGAGDFFEISESPTNIVHNGDRFFQFKAELSTTDPLYTPVLSKFGVNYNYYPTGSDLRGLWADPILMGKPENTLVTKWKTLEFNTVIPDDPVLQEQIYMKVEIRLDDGKLYPLLASFEASQSDPNNKISLESYTEVQGQQNIYLFGKISTTNSSVTPILEDWSISYDVVESEMSTLYFAGKDGKKASHYRATNVLPSLESKVDSVDVHLIDYDLQAFQDTMHVTVETIKSGDKQDIKLKVDENNIFRVQTKLPLLISDKTIEDNNILEVFDRDTLIVTYIDPHNAEDAKSDSLFIVQNTPGGLLIVDKNSVKIDNTIDFGQILYLHVFDENDKNLDPLKQDTLHVNMYDRTTNDEETVVLKEIAGEGGTYNTGEFLSETGITVVLSNNGIQGDNLLQALAGHTITAEYNDNVKKTATVSVRSDPGVATIYLGGEVYLVEVAPNPYYESEYDNFRMRVASSTGDLRVRLLEVFNLAGEKVREIDGSTLSFNVGPTVPKDSYGITEHWWDLKNDNGQQVSSGTYFVKVHADLLESNSSNFESVTYLRKFVIVR